MVEETGGDTQHVNVEAITSILDAYFDGLAACDASAIPLAEDVTLENPETRVTGEPLRGREEVSDFLEAVSENMPRIDVEQHIIDGRRICTLLEWESNGGTVVPSVDYFELDNDAISRIRIYLDLSASNLE